MKTQPLIKTNPYLKNPETRKALIARSVRTSSGVEGINERASKKTFFIPQRGEKRIYSRLKIK